MKVAIIRHIGSGATFGVVKNGRMSPVAFRNAGMARRVAHGLEVHRKETGSFPGRAYPDLESTDQAFLIETLFLNFVDMDEKYQWDPDDAPFNVVWLSRYDLTKATTRM